MTRADSWNGYSATVRMDLHVNGRRIPVAQAGGGQLVFNPPVILPGRAGELLMTIDGQEQRWHVTWQPTEQPAHIIAAHFEEC